MPNITRKKIPAADKRRSPAEFKPSPSIVEALAGSEAAFAAARRHHQAGRIDEAEALYRRVLEASSQHVGALHGLAVLAFQRGQRDVAEELLRRELAIAPNHAEALNNLGAAIAAQGRQEEALPHFDRALALRPDLGDAYFNRGLALQALGRDEEAVAAYKQSITFEPERVLAHIKLADGYLRLGRAEDAEASYKRADALESDRADVHFGLGNVHETRGQHEAAVASFLRTASLNPRFPSAHNNLGNALHAMGRFEEAREAYERAISLKADFVGAQGNLGFLLSELGDYQAAIMHYERALTHQPDYALAHWNLSLTLLTIGELVRGAAEYEWRWQTEAVKSLPDIDAPEWDGRPLPDQTLLLRCEQGFGDCLQFIRYASWARQRCGRVIVEGQGPLAPLLASVDGVDEVFQRRASLPSIAAQVPLMSLMRLSGTTLESIPAGVPYFKVDPARAANFAERIGTAGGLKVGLVWAGNPTHKNNHNRSLSLSAFAPLLAIEGVRFFSLQKGDPAGELSEAGLADRIVGLGPALSDFADTAAAISCLDLVIAVDTSVAHLAGALAKPVWTLIPFRPDWRWMLDREDSPWYPTMRLYRQQRRSEWQSVIDRIAGDLSERAKREASVAAERPPVLTAMHRAFAEAMEHHKAGRGENAEEALQQVLAIDPHHVQALYYLGICAGRRGAYQAAEDFFQRALRLAPHFAQAHYNLGNALRAQGRLDEAIVSYRSAARLEPNAFQAHNTLGNVLRAQSQMELAAKSYRRAAELNPDNAEVRLSLGVVLQAQELSEEAEEAYRQALARNPRYGEAHNNLGVLLGLQERTDEAIASFREALKHEPSATGVYANLANALRIKGHPDEAAQAYKEALAQNPDFVGALVGLGNLLRGVGKISDSHNYLERAIRIDPTNAAAHNDLAVTYLVQNRMGEALAGFERAIALNPDDVRAHFNRGMARLLQGDFPGGAADYEWRFRCNDFPTPPSLPPPVWEGQALRGQAVLLRCEQGYGDAIQFIRYAAQVKARCGRVIVQCFAGLGKLFATVPGVDEALEEGTPSTVIAAQVPLLSLMHLSGTTLESIPAGVPYFKVDPARAANFAERIGTAGGLKVGLVWAGSPTHKNNHNRSLSLSAFAPLLAIEGVRFFSLQKGDPAGELSEARLADRIVDLGPALSDFADTAAAISCLDLVIAVDTSVAHLAGALAKPVWTLIPFAPDWRWMLDREDSPWYPTMRLYRQQRRSEWQSVIDRIAGDLSERAKRGASVAAERPPVLTAMHRAFAEAMEHHKAGRGENAEKALQQVLAIDPHHAQALYYLGICAGRRGAYQAAEDYFRRALAISPMNANAHFNLGNALRAQGHLDQALISYREAVTIQPAAAPVHREIAKTLNELGRFDEAVESYGRVASLTSGDADTHLEFGNMLYTAGRLNEAIASFQRVLALTPHHAAAHHNLANALKAQNRLAEAVVAYDRAIALDPGFAQAHRNRAVTLLLSGDLTQGAAGYEWRPQSGLIRHLSEIHKPKWDGQPLPDETLVLCAEQEFGDAIQFIRYARLARQRCRHLVVHCRAPLARLFGTVPGIDEVVCDGDLLPSVGAYAPLLSLMHLFGTELDTVPAEVPYIGVDPGLVLRLEHLFLGARGLKVGLVSGGSTSNSNDHDHSLPYDLLAAARAVDNATFFSLQKRAASSEAGLIGVGTKIVDLGSYLRDFADTAAAISCLDLVICDDTAIAHLAGALGKPVWTLLPFTPRWPWLLDREDSPWYPTMRLYRQRSRGKWESVIDEVAADLLREAKSHGREHSKAGREGRALNRVFASGLVDFRAGRRGQAEAKFQKVLAGNSSHAQALYHLGLTEGQKGKHKKAEIWFRRVLAAFPNFADAHYNLGHALLAQNKTEEALSSYQCAARLNPLSSDIQRVLGFCFYRTGKYEAAEVVYRRIMQANPDDLEALLNVGNILQDWGRLDEAIEYFERVLNLVPDHFIAHYNLGNALKARGDIGEAVKRYRRALEIKPDYAEACNNLGNAHLHLGEINEGLQSYRHGLTVKPENPSLHKNLGLALLLSGDFEEGCREYEWRWRVDKSAALPPTPYPTWDGGPIPGGTILLRAEQGHGDAIQFVRYARLVRERCSRVVLQCPPNLADLLLTAPGVDEVVTVLEPPGDVVAQVPLVSLMHVLGTRLETIPAEIPYLSVDSARAADFARRTSVGRGLKVGLVWAGNPKHKNDHNRSVPLRACAPLLTVEGVDFFSLQKGDQRGELTEGEFSGKISDLGRGLPDFAATAAAISCLDLVISVDTAVAHLAGALGKPVWTLIPFAPDWRWLLEREDSPWYPTMRLFRQPARGDWRAVIASIAAALNHHAREPRLFDTRRRNTSARRRVFDLHGA